MRNESRQSYNEFLGRVAQLNGVSTADTDKAFAVAPSVQQKLENAMQESSEFLQRINIVPVDEMQGEKLGLSLSGPIASRTNTADKDRQTRDLTGISARGYHCQQTNYDSHLKYSLIDAWAKFPDFQVRVARMLAHRQALDRMCIGFNGVSISPDTNLAANPLAPFAFQHARLDRLPMYQPRRRQLRDQPKIVRLQRKTIENAIVF